ncbi:MAG: cytochrome b/b6 domain-containing protein [Hyphomicrobiaceae bacterium]|nr:MAG: cytochrome b/b6 domain-containing protein [Hyphomicrobiaceae bacterium]
MAPALPGRARHPFHPRLVRLTHWINAAATMVLVASGLQIYNAAPILPFSFPDAITLGGWLGGALLWHFAAMWVMIANLMLMLVYGLLTGRYRRRLLPLSPREAMADAGKALRGKLDHQDLSRYNGVQRLMYAGVLALLVLVVASGLAIWKPVQLGWLTSMMGGFQSARALHFLSMTCISIFLFIHLVMALLVPRSLRAMLRGH